jgi:hypothetical protein
MGKMPFEKHNIRREMRARFPADIHRLSTEHFQDMIFRRRFDFHLRNDARRRFNIEY